MDTEDCWREGGDGSPRDFLCGSLLDGGARPRHFFRLDVHVLVLPPVAEVCATLTRQACVLCRVAVTSRAADVPALRLVLLPHEVALAPHDDVRLVPLLRDCNTIPHALERPT